MVSGLIKEADDTHGAEVYLQDENDSAFKDLTFKLETGKANQMSLLELYSLDSKTLLP